MSIGFILFLYNLFLCDIDSIYTMFFLILLVILYGPRVCNKCLNKQTINEYLLYGWHVTVQELVQRSMYTLRTSSNVLVLRINLIYQFCTHLIFHPNKLTINYITTNALFSGSYMPATCMY